MPVLMANSRRELDTQQFPWPIMLTTPLLAVFLQAYLPLRYPRLDVFDLPLLVVIYFSVSRRSPIGGTLIGAIVGLLQDGVTHQPIGIHGIANTIIGFLAASIGLRIDVDNPITRVLMIFAFTLVDSSRNGTWLNGRRLARGSEEKLPERAEIGIAEVLKLSFEARK